MTAPLRIGVVGYSAQPFDIPTAQHLLRELLDAVLADHPHHTSVSLVSGLTDLGIPALAYREAQQRGWHTVGIACALATNHPCFPVDSRTLVGSSWGDESHTFLSSIDVLVRVGGGPQSLAETRAFQGPVYERELASG